MYAAALVHCPDIKGVAICDDLTLVGPAASVFRCFDWIKEHSQQLTGLTVKTTKTKVLYAPPQITPTPPTIAAEASSRHLELVWPVCDSFARRCPLANGCTSSRSPTMCN